MLTGTPFFYSPDRLEARHGLGPRIGRAVGIRAVIIAPVLVLVNDFEIRFGQAEASQEGIAGTHGNFAFHRL